VTKTLPEKLLAHVHYLPQKVFTTKQFGNIILDLAKAIRYHEKVEPDAYIDFMVERKMIDRIVIEGRRNNTVRVLTDKVALYDIALTLIPRAYLSHHSAAFLHGLTTEEPPLVYISAESNPTEKSTWEIDQDRIDHTFEQPQRTSNNVYHWNDQAFLALTSLYTGGKGIVTLGKYLLTGRERTLLDVTVRPAYGGGASNVLKMYERGLQESVSVKELIDLCDFMDFQYPYHQAIGFYLEAAGYRGKLLNSLAQRPQPFTFYLDYATKHAVYSDRWSLYYPKDI
jgi:hypothetical protein